MTQNLDRFELRVWLKNQNGVEGYVVEFDDGLRVKVKTDWYSGLHKMKELISTPRHLYETCLNDQDDDLIAMFQGDQITIENIKEMKKKVNKDYNDLKGSCEAFYFCNKELSRKDYAILAQDTLTKFEFGIAMSLYIEREPMYKETLLKMFI